MYGGLKALCEQAAEEVLPNRVLIIRPGLIVGPYDYTDRFTHWVQRIARGNEVGEVLANKDTLTWCETIRLNEELKAGIDPDKEQRLLRKWHETH